MIVHFRRTVFPGIELAQACNIRHAPSVALILPRAKCQPEPLLETRRAPPWSCVPMALEVRSEVLEYGSLPMAPWLAQIESLQQIRAVILQLLQSSSRDEQGRSESAVPATPCTVITSPVPTHPPQQTTALPAGFVSPQVIAAALDTNEMQNKVWPRRRLALVTTAAVCNQRTAALLPALAFW